LNFCEDTGIGIPIEQQSTVLKIYTGRYRKHSGTSGAGLGLAISKAFCSVIGGEIWLESQEGIGSAFYFFRCLP
jgi:signal transduction histidine kinase